MTRLQIVLVLSFAACNRTDPKGAAGAIAAPPFGGGKQVQTIVAPNMVGSPDLIVAPNMVGTPDIAAVRRIEPSPRPIPPGPR